MRQWLVLLGGMLVWTAHFFAVWTAASLFPGQDLAAWLTILLTLAGLLATALLGRRAWAGWQQNADDEIAHWISGIALLGNALAAVAILYQGLPALLF